MTGHPVERPVALAVVDTLNTALGAGRAGYGRTPDGGGWHAAPGPAAPFTGYAVVWPGQALPAGGTAAQPDADADHTVQVTYIGRVPEQADELRDRGRAALLTADLTVPGRHAWPVRLADSQPVRRDDDPTPALWYAIDRYLIHTVPA